MSNNERPVILFTNDDGIQSPGLWAAVRACSGLGDLLVVAPREQQSGMGRSMPNYSEGRIYDHEVPDNIENCTAYAVDGTPAQAVQHGILELSSVLPSLVVSGINYGDNVGNSVTISGTVGAAIEGASLGVQAIAASQQTPHDLHHSYSNDVNFGPAARYVRYFAEKMLTQSALPDDVDLIKVDVPWGATEETSWRITRLSRRRVYWPTRPERLALGEMGKIGYHFNADPADAEPDSDVYVLLEDKMVSVTPMSLDMTSRTDPFRLRQIIEGKQKYGVR